MESPAADLRWTFLQRDVDGSIADLAAAIDLYALELTESGTEPRLRRQQEKAFQKFLQDGYSSVEKALIRVLDLFEEEVPTGRSWHPDLLAFATMPGPQRAGLARPAFAPRLSGDLETLRRFRHGAVHGYAGFNVAEAAPAVAAATRVVAALPAATTAFGMATGLLPPDAG